MTQMKAKLQTKINTRRWEVRGERGRGRGGDERYHAPHASPNLKLFAEEVSVILKGINSFLALSTRFNWKSLA